MEKGLFPGTEFWVGERLRPAPRLVTDLRPVGLKLASGPNVLLAEARLELRGTNPYPILEAGGDRRQFGFGGFPAVSQIHRAR